MFVRFISRSSRVRQRNRLRVTENIRKYVIRYVDVAAAVLNEEHKVREVEKSRVIKINIVQVRFDFSSRKRPAVTASGTRRVFTRFRRRPRYRPSSPRKTRALPYRNSLATVDRAIRVPSGRHPLDAGQSRYLFCAVYAIGERTAAHITFAPNAALAV